MNNDLINETTTDEDDIDYFFIGEGNKELINSYRSPENLSKQMMFDPDESSTIMVEDDLGEFETKVEILDDDMYEELFILNKKKIFNMFDYLTTKSNMIGDSLVREIDLILGEHDHLCIREMKALKKDYFTVSSMATLYAISEMGINQVVFRQQDGCPICKSFDGLVLNIPDLIEMLTSESKISHKYCDCKLIPYINRDKPNKNLRISIDEVIINNCTMINVPVEIVDELLEIVNGLEVETIIEFTNIHEYFNNNNVENSEMIKVYEEEGIVFVSNNYTWDKGPIDYVRFYFLDNIEDEFGDFVSENTDVLYRNGKIVT